jgi:hypothetical protein
MNHSGQLDAIVADRDPREDAGHTDVRRNYRRRFGATARLTGADRLTYSFLIGLRRGKSDLYWLSACWPPFYSRACHGGRSAGISGSGTTREPAGRPRCTITSYMSLDLSYLDCCSRTSILVFGRSWSQPFMVTATVDGRPRRHILDYLWDTVGGPVVVDVVRTERLDHPDVVLLGKWTREVVESLAWDYRVLSEPPPVQLDNVRFLAGYRRSWLIHTDILDEMRARTANLSGLSVADAEREFGVHPHSLVRAALMHLLWCHELAVDLDRPLSPSTVLEAPR